ncbi:MAG TPA: hypothetical protein VF222_00770 [Nitrososphaeraceae archaeon]
MLSLIIALFIKQIASNYTNLKAVLAWIANRISNKYDNIVEMSYATEY